VSLIKKYKKEFNKIDKVNILSKNNGLGVLGYLNVKKDELYEVLTRVVRRDTILLTSDRLDELSKELQNYLLSNMKTLKSTYKNNNNEYNQNFLLLVDSIFESKFPNKFKIFSLFPMEKELIKNHYLRFGAKDSFYLNSDELGKYNKTYFDGLLDLQYEIESYDRLLISEETKKDYYYMSSRTILSALIASASKSSEEISDKLIQIKRFHDLFESPSEFNEWFEKVLDVHTRTANTVVLEEVEKLSNKYCYTSLNGTNKLNDKKTLLTI